MTSQPQHDYDYASALSAPREKSRTLSQTRTASTAQNAKPTSRVTSTLSDNQTLLAEALNFQAKISALGHDSYNAGPTDGHWREGARDDLVLAIALPCWYAEQYGDPSRWGIRWMDG